MSIREFLGFGGYQRPAEGYLSWQHLSFATALVVLMAVCAVALGRKYKNKSVAQKNRVLAVTAFLIDGVELFKILILCISSSAQSGSARMAGAAMSQIIRFQLSGDPAS